jgi:hypothetical protein
MIGDRKLDTATDHMTCESLRMRDGTSFIICNRGRRKTKRCAFCKEIAEFQCDGAKKKGRKKTCDKYICRAHATEMAETGELFIETVDYCPDCVSAGFQLTLALEEPSGEATRRGPCPDVG